MCIFCAAVPAAVSMGAMANGKQIQARNADADADQPQAAPTWLMSIPAKRATGAAVALLITASVVYHTQMGPV